MDSSKTKCYSRDRDSYPYPHGHILHALTNWANSPPLKERPYKWICIRHIKSVFIQNVIRTIPHTKMGLQCQCQVHRLCFEKELFIYTYIYVYIYEELLSKGRSPNLALTLQTRFWDRRLSHFGKELFI